jgi:nicotinamidase-related amidase
MRPPTNVSTRRPRLGWIVDVQNDFMVPAAEGGRLYVHHLNDPTDPGARQIIPALARTVRWLAHHADAVVYTGDWHADTDREIDRTAPDFRSTYPAHCMGAGTDSAERGGATIIEAVAPLVPFTVVDRDASTVTADRAARDAAAGKPVLIQKREFSVFAGQTQTDRFLGALDASLGARPEVIVCGVATDVCVRRAVEGLLDRRYDVIVVRDAVWGLGLIPDEELFARWRARGARVVTLSDLEREAGPGVRGNDRRIA